MMNPRAFFLSGQSPQAAVETLVGMAVPSHPKLPSGHERRRGNVCALTPGTTAPHPCRRSLGWLGTAIPIPVDDRPLARPVFLLVTLLLLLLTSSARAAAPAPNVAPATAAALTSQVAFDQRLGVTVPLDDVFRDERAQPATLRGLLSAGNRPALLVLGYKECPMLCSMVLGGVTETLTQLRATTGRDFDLIDVSIDPRQPPADAAAQKRLYFKRYARTGADTGWHFLTTPDDAAIHRLADAVGFRYAYETSTGQYAHPSGFVVLTPEGKVSRYFFGVNFEAREVQVAIKAAGAREVGSPIARLLLVCFHFNPTNSPYGALIVNGLRVAGILFAAVLLGGLAWLVHGDRQRARRQPAAVSPAP